MSKNLSRIDKYKVDTKNIWFPNQKEPFSDDPKFKKYWARERYRCINGFYIADGQVYIPGLLYWHTVYWNIELDMKIKNPITGKDDVFKGPGVPKFRDIEWEISTETFECMTDKEFYCLVGSRGFGKDLEENTLVHLNDKSIPIKDVNIGDKIFGADGKLTTVIDKKHFYDQVQYEITFSDGRKIQCGEGHLWTVFKKNRKGYNKLTLELKEIYKDYLIGKRKDSRYFIPINKPLQYEESVKLEIDPYYLGLWLGDGCSRDTSITSIDTEIIDYVNNYACSLNMEIHNWNKCSYRIKPKKGNKNILLHNLKKENLILNKHIPEKYLKASYEDRLALLQGIMDSDGYISKKGSIELSSSYPQLQKDYLKLIVSLGIRFKTKIKKTKCKDSLRIALFTDLNIFRLGRKKNLLGKFNSKYSITNRTMSGIINIEKLEVKPSVCIAVDNEDKLFLAGEHYIVTHNSMWLSSIEGWGYTLFDNIEILSTGGNHKDISKLNEKIEFGLSRLHPVFHKQRIKSNWKEEVRAGYIDQKTGLQKGSDSRILSRNYRDGNNTMATNGTRPKIQSVDEIGKIPNLKACVFDSMPSWMADGGVFSFVILAGTGGNMQIGKDAGEIFNDPRSYNVKKFLHPTTSKNIGKFMPVTKARNEYKEEWTLYKYLTEKFPEKYSDLKPHKDLEITILVSNEEKCLKEFVEPRREIALQSGDTNGIIKEKAYYPISPEECFLTLNLNDYPVEGLKQHEIFLQQSFFKARRVDLLFGPDGKVEWRDSEKLPVTDFPVKPNSNKTGVVEILEPPVPNAPAYLYVAGIDPYKTSETEYSNSVGSVYIWKRKTDDMTEVFQDMPVAWYHGRPKDIKEWQENVRMLLHLYNASAMSESNDENFIIYMQERNEEFMLARGQSYLKELNPNSKFKGAYGLPATPTTINHWNNSSVRWTKEIMSKEVKGDNVKNQETKMLMGYTKIIDKMLIKELINFNKKEGNFDRQRAFSIACAYAKQLDANLGSIGEIDDYSENERRSIYKSSSHSTFSLNKFNKSISKTGYLSSSPFSLGRIK